MTKYKVHSRHDTTKPVDAELPDGTKVIGHLPIAIIELVDADGYCLTLRKRLVPDAEKEKIDAIFVIGNTVQIGDFTLVEDEPAPKEAT